MSISLPTIAWEVKISNAAIHPTTDYYYTCTVDPININDPGYGELVVGYYIVDYIGHIFEIIEVNSYDLVVHDLIEDTQYTGPYNDQTGFVYDSLYKAALVAQGTINSLDESAEDFIRNLGLSPKVFDSIQFNTNYTPSSESEGLTWWNSDYNTLNISTGYGSYLPIGQEMIIKVYNDTGVQIDIGSAVKVSGINDIYPKVTLAIADTFEGFDHGVFIANMNIPNGTYGFVVKNGKIRGIDTSSWTVGQSLYLSEENAGELTTISPSFPNYELYIGCVMVQDAIDGILYINSTRTKEDTFENFWNGIIREQFDFRITSNGTTITGTLTAANAANTLTLICSDGYHIIDVTTPPTVVLTPGIDTNFQTNYIYILCSTTTLTSSTSGFPNEEHAKIAEIVVASALRTRLGGAIRNQNVNDELAGSANHQGHLSHIVAKLRALDAQWESGAEGTVNITANVVTLQNTAGIVSQLHEHEFQNKDTRQYAIDAVNTLDDTFTISGDGDLSSTYPIGKILKVNGSTGNDRLYRVDSTSYIAPNFIIKVTEPIPSAIEGVIPSPIADGTIGDDINVVNDFTTPYINVSDLTDITLDASGNSLNNTSFSTVRWGVVNKTGEVDQLMLNLPTNTYSKNFPIQAVSDSLNYSVYEIPKQFKGVGFLIARDIWVNSGGNWSLYDTEDLRGRIPNSTAGGGGGGTGVVTFLGLTDTPSAFTGQAEKLIQINAGETALEFISDIKIDSISEYTTNNGILIGSTLFIDQENEKIGINTIDPIYKLDIHGTSATDGISSQIGYNISTVTEPIAPTFSYGAGGSVDDGTHFYVVTYITAIGETSAGTFAQATVSGLNTVTLTIPVSTDERVTGRNIYRTKAGDPQYLEYYLATVNNNTETSYIDTTADSSLTGLPGVVTFKPDTTNQFITLDGVPLIKADTKVTNFGYNAGQSITTGGRNVFMGSYAGDGATTTTDSVIVGYNAGSEVMTGGQNVLMGAYTGRLITSGASNTGIGSYSLFSATTGISNTAIGRNSLFSLVSGGYNTALGYYSGRLTTGTGNTYLGYKAGDAATSGNYNILIGYQVEKPAITDSSKLNIGNTIYGDLSTKQISLPGSLLIDTIDEYTSTSGVTIESVLIKDGFIDWGYISNTPTTTVGYGITDAVLLTGNQSVDGIKTFSSFGITPSLAPTEDYQWANKKYVDGISPQNVLPSLSNIGNNNTSLWLISPKGTYYNGNTYIVYLDLDDNDRKIAKYNHETEIWTIATWTQTPIDTGNNSTTQDYAHGSPSIFIDSSGYIHISYGSYKNIAMYTVTSTNIEDITAFDSEVTVESGITGSAASYPTMLEINSILILFYRGANAGTTCISRAISSDNGATWGNIINLTDYYTYYQVRKDFNDRIHISWHAKPSTTNDDLYYVYSDDAEVASPTWKTVDTSTITIPFSLTDAKIFESSAWDNCYLLGIIPDDNQKIHIFTYVSDSSNTDKLLYFEYSSSTWNEVTIVEENLSSWTVGSIQGDVIYKDGVIKVMSEYISDPTFGTYGKAEIKEWISGDKGNTWIFNGYITKDSIDTTANPFYIRNSGQHSWFLGDNNYGVGKEMYVGIYNSNSTNINTSSSSVTIGNTGQIPFSNTGTPGTDFNYSDNFSWSGTVLNITGNLGINGTLYQTIGTLAVSDTTPDVNGANIWKWTDVGTGVTLTNLDNATVGAIYIIYNDGSTYVLEITDGGNFKLAGNWSGGAYDSITLLCVATNSFIELSRSNN